MSDFRPPYNKSLLEMFFRNFQSTVKEQLLPRVMQNLFQKEGLRQHEKNWVCQPIWSNGTQHPSSSF